MLNSALRLALIVSTWEAALPALASLHPASMGRLSSGPRCLSDLIRSGAYDGLTLQPPWPNARATLPTAPPIVSGERRARKTMATAISHAAAPRWMRWLGFTLSGPVILFMLIDATMKLMQLPIVLETTEQIGWPVSSAVPLGIVLLLCTALYAFPLTSVLGAILLTAYLGGTVATHARIGSPLFSHMLFGVYLGVMLWAGLYLRDERVRALIPYRV